MILSGRSSLCRWNTDQVTAALLSVFAGLSCALLLVVLCFLVKEALPVISNGGWRLFFASDGWHPLEGKFGLLPMVLSTLAITVGAIVFAVPLGLAGAIFVCFYAPTVLANVYRAVIQVLAGIPSVVYGLWGLTVLVPLVAQLQPPGSSLIAAVLILSLMILPTITLTGIAALDAVPPGMSVGADALGFSRAGRILYVALPASRTGIMGGILLAMARALGETMAVLMVAGNVVQNPHSLFAPVRALTANIALEMAYAMDLHRAALFASGLFLTLIVFSLSLIGSRSAVTLRHD